MTSYNVDIPKLQREIAILTTNSVELMNKMYEIFVEDTPADVELRVWTDEGFQTMVVPNLAKSRIPVRTGEGYPEHVDGDNIGTVYINSLDGSIYMCASTDPLVWFQFASMKEINDHNIDEYAHNSVLASIHGNSEEQFYVGSTDRDSDKYLAVNIESLDYFLGHINNLDTTDKESIVGALNEALYVAEKEAGVITDVNNNRVSGTKKPKVFRIIISDLGEFSLAMEHGLRTFSAIKANGTKYTCTDVESILPQTNLTGSKMAVFLKDLDQEVPSFECIPDGNYYISEKRPLIMKEGDVWLDTGCRPYQMWRVVINDNVYEDEAVDYIYLGTIEEI